MSPRDMVTSHMTVPFRRSVVVLFSFVPVSTSAAIAVVPVVVPVPTVVPVVPTTTVVAVPTVVPVVPVVIVVIVVAVMPFPIPAIVVAVVPTLIRVGTWRKSDQENDSEANGGSDVHGSLHPFVWMEGFQRSYRLPSCTQ